MSELSLGDITRITASFNRVTRKQPTRVIINFTGTSKQLARYKAALFSGVAGTKPSPLDRPQLFGIPLYINHKPRKGWRFWQHPHVMVTITTDLAPYTGEGPSFLTPRYDLSPYVGL